MNIEVAHTRFWKTSDVVFGGALLIGVALDYIFPLSLENIVLANVRVFFGGFVASIGILIIVLTKVQFARAKQPSAPGKPTTALVQHGIFNYTRNPLYLGLVITLAGFGVAFNMPWWIILTGPVIGLVHRALIIPEERYLAERFGDEYLVYVARVRRWI